MKISEFKIFLDNSYIGITEYIERLILIFSNQIPDNMELGDIIFLSILILFILSLVLSSLFRIKVHKKVGLESYYLDQIAIQSKKDDADSNALH
jgi:hypothetical protein